MLGYVCIIGFLFANRVNYLVFWPRDDMGIVDKLFTVRGGFPVFLVIIKAEIASFRISEILIVWDYQSPAIQIAMETVCRVPDNRGNTHETSWAVIFVVIATRAYY